MSALITESEARQLMRDAGFPIAANNMATYNYHLNIMPVAWKAFHHGVFLLDPDLSGSRTLSVEEALKPPRKKSKRFHSKSRHPYKGSK